MGASLLSGRPWFFFDYRGRGRSSPPEGPLTLDGFLADLEAVARTVGRPFDLYSFMGGCPIAVAFAARCPEWVERVILHLPIRVERDRVVDPEWGRVFTDGNVTALKMLLQSWQDEQIDDAAATEVAALWAPTATRAFVGAVRHAVWDVDLVETGRKLSCPVLLCGPDSLLGPLLAMAAEWPGACVGVEGNNRNGEEFGRELADLLERHLPSHGSAPAAGPVSPVQRQAESLSPRELEVLALVAQGCSNAQIGERLVIATGTAARHVAAILSKLGLHSRAQATAYAYEHDLVRTAHERAR